MFQFLILSVAMWHVTSSNAMAVDPTREAFDAVSRSINTFSSAFFKAVAEEKTANIICSPLSASMVLSMAAFGARGNTEQQLRSALAFPSNDALTKTGIQSLVDSFVNFKEVELRLANQIFLAEGFEPKAEFMGMIERAFRSKAKSLNFGKAVEAAKTINDWCEAQTNNRIKDLIKADDLDSNTALMLVNAVYFKGNWAEKFNAEHTKLRPFYVDGTTVKDVPTMYRSGSYRYGELPQVNAEFVELPYKSNDYSDAVSMFIILPNERNGLPELAKNLEKVSVAHLLGAYEYDVDVYLPKFKIESSINLDEPLKKMGLTDMFESTANFTGIVDSRPLYVSKVIQKAFIEVNEEGSEAAAATGVQAVNFSVPMIVEFRVNHPFIYAIVKRSQDRNTGIPIFYGQVSNFQ